MLQLWPAFLYAQDIEHLMTLKRELASQHLPPIADTSFSVLKENLGNAIKKKDNLTAAIYLRRMGGICFHMGHFPQALDYHLQVGKLYAREGQTRLLATNLNDIGTIYFYLRQAKLARQQYDEALTLFSSLHDEAGMALTLGHIGHLYEKKHHYEDSAFYYQRQALTLYSQVRDITGEAKIYENIGSIFDDLKRFDSAASYFKKALILDQQLGDSVACIEIYNNLGDMMRKTTHYREALQFSYRALQLSTSANEQYQHFGTLRDISKTYHLMHNNDSAYEYLLQAHRYASKIYSWESGQQFALLQVMYDIEKKNDEIELLGHTRKTTRIITVGIVILGILLAILAMLIISRQRLRIKNGQRINEQERHIYQTQKELMETALENKRLQELNLKNELEVRSKELSTYTLHVIQKNQFLEEVCNKLDEMVKDERRDQKRQLKQLQLQINQRFNHDQQWEEFRNIFEQVHHTFFNAIKKHNDTLTSNDMRMLALLKMELDPTDIASLLGISQDSLRVVRYRLKKKLQLQQGESLSVFIKSL